MKSFTKWIASAGLACLISACGGGSGPGNIAEVAQSNNLTALVSAVNKAGLSGTLTATNANLTVFAPTDAAFNTLATQLGFVNATAMVNALSPADLASILTYHVLPSKKSAADLQAGGPTQATAYSFGGTPTNLKLNIASGVAITDEVLTTAHVTRADVPANNGVVHVIDKVLVPPGVLNVVQMAQANPTTFSSLVAAVVSTDLTSALSGAGPFTVFAPTNAAFSAAPSGLSTSQLTSVLLYHVLSGQVLSTQITFGTPINTLDTTKLNGGNVQQTITINSDLTITDTTATAANIVATDIKAKNGVIHVIDKVLIPN
ncbi:MAG: fasciclin domain-containing protein [Betaproteobacteria bacterium]